jgi:hypothetical protein
MKLTLNIALQASARPGRLNFKVRLKDNYELSQTPPIRAFRTDAG